MNQNQQGKPQAGNQARAIQPAGQDVQIQVPDRRASRAVTTTHRPKPRVQLTTEQQVMALQMFVPNYALGERKQGVAGGQDWTPHEWVIQALDVIFGPDNWSSECGKIEQVRTDDGEIMIYIPVTLSVTFENGRTVRRSDIGVGVVRRTKSEREAGSEDLGATPIDSYSTGWKAALTSGLKGCCRDLGRVFIPMQSPWVAASITRGMFEGDLRSLVIGVSGRDALPAPMPLLDQETPQHDRARFWVSVATSGLTMDEASNLLQEAGGDYATAAQNAAEQAERKKVQEQLARNKQVLGRDGGGID